MISIRIRVAVLAAALALFGSTQSALAWNDTGHSTIALITYRQLPKGIKANLDTILKAHPQYERDLLKDCPAGADKEEYAFTRACVWPDMIRGRDNPMNQYHRGLWHYTNVPFFPEGGEDKYKVSISPPVKPGEPYDAISAFEYSLRLLKNDKAKPADRAIALCWVLHLGSDVHQPLHCGSMFSEASPDGDRGGNLWEFIKDGQPMNLHAIWDGALGENRSPERIQTQATEMTTAHPRSEFKDILPAQDVRDWVAEGRKICIERVYLYGMIKLAKKGETPTPAVTKEYTEQMEQICKVRGALSGYRLADTLSRVMADGGVAPGMTK